MKQVQEVPPGLAMLSVACHTSLCYCVVLQQQLKGWHLQVLLSLTSVFSHPTMQVPIFFQEKRLEVGFSLRAGLH